MTQLIDTLWSLGNEMGIYILGGLFIAGILHQLVRESAIKKHLGNKDAASVYKAALLGAPLPLCSCSVIPFAVSLRKSGASKGSTLSFLISTPITGIDSILATFGMFGWIFTFYRLMSSVLIAIAAGFVMNRFDHEQPAAKPVFGLSPKNSVSSFVRVEKPSEEKREKFSILKIFTYGYGTLLGSFAKSLAWGLIIGTIISVAFEGTMLQTISQNHLLGYIGVIALAVPMYVCATASLPIAASLLLAGASPGMAFIFLTAGPATNTVTIGVVKSQLGSKAMWIYLGVILAGSLTFGYMIDLLFSQIHYTLPTMLHEHHGIVIEFATWIFFALIAWHLIKPLFIGKKESCSGGSCCS